MHIERLNFRNFRLLRDASLPLEPLTLLVGANGSGKSSVFESLRYVAENRADLFADARTLDVPPTTSQALEAVSRDESGPVSQQWLVPSLMAAGREGWPSFEVRTTSPREHGLFNKVRSFRTYDLAASQIAAPSPLVPRAQLQTDGGNLAAALDQLRDRDPERWLQLNDALPLWIPEFDQVLFDTPEQGTRRVVLRTRRGRERLPAHLLSSGTRLVLGLLAITYGETQTRFLGIEEPETGIHPRLLRNVYEALVRITDPSEPVYGSEARQVIVTTHSPYLVDLFRDQPESVVVAERHVGGAFGGDGVTFTRLSDRQDIDEVVSAGPLGEAWYTGALGGVPVLPGPGPVTPAASAGA